MTSILEPITLDLSEINITSLYSLFLDCVQNKCLQFVLLLVAATKKKLRVYRCTWFHFFEDDHPEAKRWRKKWVDFVKQKRPKWQPSKRSVICSLQFKPEDFERRFFSLSYSAVHSASASGSSAYAAAFSSPLLVERSENGPWLFSSISYDGESTEFTSINSNSFSDADICRSARTSVCYNNSWITKK